MRIVIEVDLRILKKNIACGLFQSSLVLNKFGKETLALGEQTCTVCVF